jgi:serine/threonine-protein phosphatase 2B regulatory subunit
MGNEGSQPKARHKSKMQGKGSKARIEAKRAPSTNDFVALTRQTKFSEAELHVLWLKFKRLSESQTQDGRIDIREFQAALGIRSEGFATRIFAAFDSDVSLEIDFNEFALGIYAMSPRASIEEKAKFCFDVYDFDGNKSIDRAELSQILRFSLNENKSIRLTEEQIQKIIDRTYDRIDKNGDGGISYEEFLAEARRNPQILACVAVDVETLLRPQ